MRFRTFYSFAAAALLVAAAAHADMTAEDILAKNAAAKGGMEKLTALKSVRMTGKMSMGGGMEAPFTMTKKRPEMMRVDFTVQGLTGSQAYDGTNGWLVMPFMGKKDPEAMSGDMLKGMKEEADFDGPFINSAAKGYKIELVGKTEVEGTPAYQLKVTKDDDVSNVYVDADSFLEIKIDAKRKIQGQEVESETSLSNYQDVGGMLFPMSIESKRKGAPAGQTITVEKVELNPTVGDDVFKMPAKAAAAPATPEKKQ